MENKIIKLKNVFVCENAVVAFDGKLSLINLFSEITAKGFPAINPKFTIVSSIVGDIGSHDETIEIISLVNDKVLAKISGRVDIKSSGGNNFIANFINIAFPEEGIYWVKVEVDGNVLNKKDEHFISVKKN